MYYFDQLPATLKNHFESTEGFGNYEFLTEFPGTLRKTPLTRLTVSFGLNNVNITQPLSEDGVPVYDSYHESATSVRFIIHAPRSFGGNSLYIAFARISNILLNNFDMDIDEIDCGEISYDRNTDSIRLTAEFVARRAII
jgi:hypothetical protein